MADNKKLLSILPAVIICIGVILRLIYINTDFWYDEACSWFSAKQDFPFGIMDNLLTLDLQHTPLYFFILHFWMKIFGDSEIAIRSLSIIFGILSLPLAYIISEKLFDKNKIISSSITIITAVSPLLVFFSVEARMYPVSVFLVLLSLNFLIDFERKKDKKSLVKLIISNLLIPYTLVGGIFYNISLAIGYSIYLFLQKKESLTLYLKGVFAEIICLIPYFILVGYYAKMRSLFVVKHEGEFAFWQMVEVIRNFFGASLVNNPYWPTLTSYDMTPGLVFMVMIPCGYFVYGLFKGFKNSSGFLKSLYYIFFSTFVLALIFAVFQVNVFTMRYILYLLIPFFILSIYGLAVSLTKKHLTIFLAYFVIASIGFDVHFSKFVKVSKHMALASVQDEAKALELTNEDIIIAPFASDAPYYFRKENNARVHNFDFHKEIRNPYNEKFYDITQQQLMNKNAKYGVIYDTIFADRCFSDNFVEFFLDNVNNNVNSGRFVLVALYGEDGSQLVTIDELRDSIKNITDVKDSTVQILLKKYLYDIRFLLEKDFTYINMYRKGNFTYILYQKR